MKNKYIGTKLANAEQMTRLEYSQLRGLDLPTNENGDDAGYLVENVGENANTETHAGYVSWSSKESFEREYREINGMTFGSAVEALKLGKKVARMGWNGKGMWLVLMPSLYFQPFSSQSAGAKVNDRTARHIGKDNPLDCQPYIAMWTALEQWQPGWLASQADMLAEDWVVLDA